jgi:hypothetical protein
MSRCATLILALKLEPIDSDQISQSEVRCQLWRRGRPPRLARRHRMFRAKRPARIGVLLVLIDRTGPGISQDDKGLQALPGLT